ncbi:MAG: ABC transporter ATP-binding protein [Desulfobacteraceae bacterium]|nr:ABC transporter ATP-binding protein [Desulfobacteraceae bacterium]
MAYIKIKDLHYTYENGLVALDGLSLEIGKGEIFGLLGPNGAGKTTLFKILVGVLEATQGKALIDGRQIKDQEREVYKNIGFMPDVTDAYGNYTVEEFLRFFGLCHSMSDEKIRERTDELLQKFKLEEKRDQLLRTLSTGQKQKAYIIRTMIHDPEVLILDEPASGLDPHSRKLLMSALRELGEQGKTIVISSHILRELADLCNAIGILYQGKLIEYGRVAELISKYQNPVSAYQIDVVEKMDIAMKHLGTIHSDQLHSFQELSEKSLLIEYDGDEHNVSNLLEILIKSGTRISGFEKVEKDIETIYGEILNE